MRAVRVVTVLAGTLFSAGAAAQDGLSPADRVLARDIFRQLIEINTTDSLGNTPRAARAMAQRLRAAGFAAPDLRVLIGPDATHGNLVARYRGTGTGGRPIVVFAHLDVVPARRSDWSVDPFTFLEKDGYFYGRGTTDDKVGDAVLIANFIRLQRDHFKPTRDLILVLTGDEETNGSCIQWLVTKHRDLVDAEFALNTDAGGGVLRDGRRVMFTVQASEKVYATYALEATDKGGHSSLPRPADNPIYRLAGVLERLRRRADQHHRADHERERLPDPPRPGPHRPRRAAPGRRSGDRHRPVGGRRACRPEGPSGFRRGSALFGPTIL